MELSWTALVEEDGTTVTVDASGVVPVGPSRFVFVNNKDPKALYELVLTPDGNQAEPVSRRLLTGLAEGALSDPEGLARIDVNGVIYLIVASSLSDYGTGAHDGLVRVRYTSPPAKLQAEAMPYFRAWLLERLPDHLAQFVETTPDNKGFNVEGLTWDPRDKTLLFGVRSPTHNGRIAVLQVRLRSTTAPWKTASLEVLPTLYLNRATPGQEQGIRDIAYDLQTHNFLVLQGRSRGADIADFQLCTWKGGNTADVEVLLTFGQPSPTNLKPEGVTAFQSGNKRKILIVDDSGHFATVSADAIGG